MGVRRSAKRINPSVAPLRGQRTHDTILTRAVSRPVPLPVGDQCKIGTMIADWRTEAQRYELRDIGSGNWAYMLKPEERGSEYPAWLCPTCFAQGLKGGFYSSLPSSPARDRSTAAVNARATRWCRANRTGFEARNIDADLRDFNCCRPAPVRLAECSPPERLLLRRSQGGEHGIPHAVRARSALRTELNSAGRGALPPAHGLVHQFPTDN